MNTLQIRGNWNIAKGKMKQKFAQLTADDLQYLEGQEDELLGRFQKRTRRTQKEIEQALEENFDDRVELPAGRENERVRKSSH